MELESIGAGAGTVSLPEARGRWTDTLGQVSDHQGQFGELVGKSSGRRSVGAEIIESPAEVLNEGMACDADRLNPRPPSRSPRVFTPRSDPWVRRVYCDEAIESAKQEAMISSSLGE